MFKMPPYAIRIAVVAALLCAACTPSSPPRSSSFESGSLALKQWGERYGRIEGGESTAYLLYLTQRLSRARIGRVEPGEVVALSTPEPFALSLGGGFMVISAGLIARLQNEAELAFVLAHEFAHRDLLHSADDPQTAGDRDHTKRAEAELAADAYALGLIARAGYDPRAATSALLHTYGQWTNGASSADYPALEERLAALQSRILTSGWRPPGTLDRYDFQRFRAVALRSATAPRG